MRPIPALVSAALIALAPATAVAAAPTQVVEDSLVVPAGVAASEALAAVEELPEIFDRYAPVVPWVPGLTLDLGKEVVSDGVAEGTPIVLAMPVEGAVFGRSIDETARVTVTSMPTACAAGVDGLRIDLSFDGSSHNVWRRVDRIEITACPRLAEDGTLYVDTRGALYEGHLPRDPDLNAFEENIGAKAIQTAFLKQVPAVFEAVEAHWADTLGPPV